MNDGNNGDNNNTCRIIWIIMELINLFSWV